MRRKTRLIPLVCVFILLWGIPADAAVVPSPITFDGPDFLPLMEFSTVMPIVDGDWSWEGKQENFKRFLSLGENTAPGKLPGDKGLKVTIDDARLSGRAGNEVRVYMDLKDALSLRDHEWVVSHQVMISDYTADVKIMTGGFHFATFHTDGKIYGGADASQELGVWEKNQWYTLTAVLHFEATECDLYINNKKVDGKVGMRKEAASSGLAAVDLHVYPTRTNGIVNPCEVWFDNIFFTDLGKGTGIFQPPVSVVAEKTAEQGGKLVENADGTLTVLRPNDCGTAAAYLEQFGSDRVRLYDKAETAELESDGFMPNEAALVELLPYGTMQSFRLLPFIRMEEVRHTADTGAIAVRVVNEGEQPAESWLLMAAYQNGLLTGWDRQAVTAGAGGEQTAQFRADPKSDEIHVWMVDSLEETRPMLRAWVYQKGE